MLSRSSSPLAAQNAHYFCDNEDVDSYYSSSSSHWLKSRSYTAVNLSLEDPTTENKSTSVCAKYIKVPFLELSQIRFNIKEDNFNLTQNDKENDCYLMQSDKENSQNINYFFDKEEADNLFSYASSISLSLTSSHLPHENSFYTVINMCVEEPETEKVFMCFLEKINFFTLFETQNKVTSVSAEYTRVPFYDLSKNKCNENVENFNLTQKFDGNYYLSQSEDEEVDLDLDSTSVQYTRLIDGCLKTECFEIDDDNNMIEMESIVQQETKYKIDINEMSHKQTEEDYTRIRFTKLENGCLKTDSIMIEDSA